MQIPAQTKQLAQNVGSQMIGNLGGATNTGTFDTSTGNWTVNFHSGIGASNQLVGGNDQLVSEVGIEFGFMLWKKEAVVPDVAGEVDLQDASSARAFLRPVSVFSRSAESPVVPASGRPPAASSASRRASHTTLASGVPSSSRVQ